MKNKILSVLLLFFLIVQVNAENPLWLRYPAISPDGNWIVFSYKGDIYKVKAEGGAAVPVTTHQAHDFMPVWSHDGKKIAFSSLRYGNYDIFLMNAEGGKAKRLTYHSSNDYTYSFAPGDSTILFSSSRLDDADNVQFPSGAMPELYSISINGKLSQVLTTPALDAQWNKNGSKLIYHDKKGYEDSWRKHHTSSITRQIWIYDKASGKHNPLSSFQCENRNPLWSNDESRYYFLSEKSGSFNVWTGSVSNTNETKQITSFDKNPVRFLSKSANDIICFGFDGEIYTMKEGENPKKVIVSINADDEYNEVEYIDVANNITELILSPNGNEIAFISRGEVFVTALDYSNTKRITNTATQERSVSFSPDGRTILYAGERNGSWNIYRSDLTRKEEKLFYNSTGLKETPVLETEAETFQPAFSPDGKEVAYLEERTELKVINLETKATRTIMPSNKNYSYSDGDIHYEWSPDGNWFLMEYLAYNRWNDDVGLVDAQGKNSINLTESGYSDNGAKWMMDGKLVIWFSGRHGMKSHGSWGTESDVYGIFLEKEAYQIFKMQKDEFLAYKKVKEKEKKDKEEKDKKEGIKKEDEDGKPKKLEPVVFDLEKFRDRKERLTINSSFLSDAIMTKDGSKLFYLSKFEKDYNLWVHDFKENETKLFAAVGSSGGSIQFDSKEENIIVLSNKKIVKINAKDGKIDPVEYTAKMEFKPEQERAYIFGHVWRQTKKKFYVEDMQGVNWEFYKNNYIKFLPYINNNYDFSEMLSEMLGELNASHTGSGNREQDTKKDETAALAFYPDYSYNGKGVKIKAIMDKSPLLLLKQVAVTGDIIQKIDGEEVIGLEDFYLKMNHRNKQNTLLTFYNAETKKTYEEVIKPISMGEEYDLAYQRWVKTRNKEVERLSGGKIGYVHVRGMNDESFRETYSDVLGKHADKDALIVDTRFNGGGWLHDDLATFLGGKPYATFLPRGQNLGKEPLGKWYKPSAVLISESNYSDAHGFPFAYRALNIGKTIGMPIPGTMTAVWWETQINGTVYFGIPQVGFVDNEGKFQENYQFEPDVKVRNDYDSVAKGRDRQLEKAVEELLKK